MKAKQIQLVVLKVDKYTMEVTFKDKKLII